MTNEQAPSSPNLAPNVSFTHEGSRIRLYRLDEILASEEPLCVYERNVFERDVQEVSLTTQVKDVDGERCLVMDYRLAFDSLQQTNGTFIRQLRTALLSTGPLGKYYGVHETDFYNLLSVRTRSGLQMGLTLGDGKIHISNQGKYEPVNKDYNNQKPVAVVPRPLDLISAEVQLSDMGRVIAGTMNAIERMAHDSAKDAYSDQDMSLRLGRMVSTAFGLTTFVAGKFAGRPTYDIGKTIYALDSDSISDRANDPEDSDVSVTKAPTRRRIERSADSPAAKPALESVRLEDVGGNAKLKEDLAEIVVALKHPEIMARWGSGRPQGILLYGEAGNGKSMIARALATELGADLRVVQSGEIYNMYLGQSVAALRRLFAEFKRTTKPLVVVLDEFDTMFGITDNASGSSAGTERNDVAGTFKREMDELATNPHVVIVATTNHLDRIDESITRSLRFDYKLYVPMPAESARVEIFASIMSKLSSDHDTDDFHIFADDVRLPELAKMTEGFSGADVKNLINQLTRSKAAQEARTGEVSPISHDDLVQAILAFNRDNRP